MLLPTMQKYVGGSSTSMTRRLGSGSSDRGVGILPDHWHSREVPGGFLEWENPGIQETSKRGVARGNSGAGRKIGTYGC